jgi:hypothetical protein
MQGIRINEAFGDTVNWDFIPTIAIAAPTSGPTIRPSASTPWVVR